MNRSEHQLEEQQKTQDRMWSSGLIFVGLCVIVYAGLLVWYSQQPALQGTERNHTWAWIHVITGIIAGVIYFGGVWAVVKQGVRVDLKFVMMVGLIARGMMFFSQPILQDDHHRYLWDGAIIVAGMNPYQYAPGQYQLKANDDLTEAHGGIERIVGVGQPTVCLPQNSTGHQTHGSINHKHLNTIYPPVAQLLFGAASYISPFSLNALRLITLMLESITIVILLMLLRKLALPATFLMIYYWNPLLISEIFNEVHMDGLVLPFLVTGIFLAGLNYKVRSAVVLALGFGVKLFPLLLFPVCLKGIRKDNESSGKMILAGGLFLLLCVIFVLPMLMAIQNSETSSLINYVKSWQNNDGLFTLLIYAAMIPTKILGLPEGAIYAIPRIIVVGVMLGVVIWSVRTPVNHVRELIRRCIIILAIYFLISPTQFPWYFSWVIVLVAMRPSLALLSYTFLLPLYDLTYDFPMLRIIEHLPVLIILYIEIKRGEWGGDSCVPQVEEPDINKPIRANG